MDKLIDFRNYSGEPLRYDSRSKEYGALNDLKDSDWQDYLDTMAASGVTVEYDADADEFIVTGSITEAKKSSPVNLDDPEAIMFPMIEYIRKNYKPSSFVMTQVEDELRGIVFSMDDKSWGEVDQNSIKDLSSLLNTNPKDLANELSQIVANNLNENIMVTEGLVEDIKNVLIDKPVDKLVELYKKYLGSEPLSSMRNNVKALATEIATMVAGDKKIAAQVMSEAKSWESDCGDGGDQINELDALTIEDIKDVLIDRPLAKLKELYKKYIGDTPSGDAGSMANDIANAIVGDKKLATQIVSEGVVEDIKDVLIDKPIDKLRELYKKYIGAEPVAAMKNNAKAIITMIATMVAENPALAKQVMMESAELGDDSLEVNEGVVEDIRNNLMDKPVEKLRELYKKYIGADARKEIANNAKAMITLIATMVAENPALAKQVMMESADNVDEGRASAASLLNSVIKGETKEVEGVALSKEMAQAYADWLRMSPYGKKYGNDLPFNKLFKASFLWGFERYVPKELGAEFKELEAKAKSMSEADCDVNEGVVEDIRANLIDKPIDKLRELYKKYIGAEPVATMKNNAKAIVTMIATMAAENPALAKQLMMESVDTNESFKGKPLPTFESFQKMVRKSNVSESFVSETEDMDSKFEKAIGEAQLTDDAQEFISDKISTLMGEGKPQDQAIAIAHSMAKEAGYDVPENPNEGVLFADQVTEAKDVTDKDLFDIAGEVYDIIPLPKNYKESDFEKIITDHKNVGAALKKLGYKDDAATVKKVADELMKNISEGVLESKSSTDYVGLPNPSVFVTERKHQILRSMMVRESLAEIEAKDIYVANMDHTAITEEGEEVKLKAGDKVEIQEVDLDNGCAIAKFGDQEITLKGDDFVGDAPVLERVNESEDGELFGDQISVINKWFETYDGAEEFEWNGKTLTLKDKDGNEINTMTEEDLAALIPNFPVEAQA